MSEFLQCGDARARTSALLQAVECLRAGGVAVFPTDTVWGIAQLMQANPQGPARLFAIKKRPFAKKIPLLIGGVDELSRYGCAFRPYVESLAHTFWPAGLTLVVQASDEVPEAYCSPEGTIALRMPGPSLALELVGLAGSALATTSANTSGLPAASEYDELEDVILEQADIVLIPGTCTTSCNQPSTIVDCTGPQPRLVREGPIGARELSCACGLEVRSS